MGSFGIEVVKPGYLALWKQIDVERMKRNLGPGKTLPMAAGCNLMRSNGVVMAGHIITNQDLTRGLHDIFQCVTVAQATRKSDLCLSVQIRVQ